MQKRIFPLFLLIIPLVLVSFNGCGEDDQGSFYYGSFETIDNDETTLSIDIVQGVCDGGTAEDFTDVYAEVTITASDVKPGIMINNYIIEYIPRSSDDGSGTWITPPEIGNLEGEGSGGSTNFVDSGSSLTYEMTCFSISQKDDLATALSNAGLYQGRYTIRITLYCTDEYGEGVDIVLERTVYFANYDNC